MSDQPSKPSFTHGLSRDCKPDLSFANKTIYKTKQKKEEYMRYMERASAVLTGGLLIGSLLEIWSEPRGDRWVIHNFVIWWGVIGQHSELFCFLLSETTRRKPRPRRFRLKIRLRSALLFLSQISRFTLRPNVVGLSGPPKERGPPVGRGGGGGDFATVRVGSMGNRCGRGSDRYGSQGDEISSHW